MLTKVSLTKYIDKINFCTFKHGYTKLVKFFPTQRELKSLEAQVIRSKHNLSTYIHVGKALIEENGHSLVKMIIFIDRWFTKHAPSKAVD